MSGQEDGIGADKVVRGAFQIRDLDPSLHSAWDGFCATEPDAWFWHTTSFMMYQEAYRPALGTRPCHFIVEQDGQLVAACLLALETIDVGENTVPVFSFGGDFLPAPIVSASLGRDVINRVRRLVHAEVDRRAGVHGVARVAFQEPVLTPRILEPATAPINSLLPFGFLDASLRSQVLDLRRGEDELWADVRRSYRSPIRRAEEEYTFRFLDRDNITPDMFRTYRELHHKAAGRVTRPLCTFETMCEWVRNGQAVIAQALTGTEVVSSALLVIFRNDAYYLSGCTDPEEKGCREPGYLVQWKIILELRKRGVTFYDIGLQYDRPSMAYQPTDKEMDIAFFKRGFGGVSVPWIRAEKFYNADLFRREYARRVDAAASWIAPVSNRDTVSGNSSAS